MDLVQRNLKGAREAKQRDGLEAQRGSGRGQVARGTRGGHGDDALDEADGAPGEIRRDADPDGAAEQGRDGEVDVAGLHAGEVVEPGGVGYPADEEGGEPADDDEGGLRLRGVDYVALVGCG